MSLYKSLGFDDAVFKLLPLTPWACVFTKVLAHKKNRQLCWLTVLFWLREQDLNLRPVAAAVAFCLSKINESSSGYELT
ncbi:hypothetical protein SU32_13660 [Ahrensia marina]|uniref:Uncharacterized protein n=1 Tax=Ahrensia marina TaxID=1514904 RepID=A0A0N0E6V4_9HYPH|nr:hypothetical protein SU32_13660 [Ahrensia marina]